MLDSLNIDQIAIAFTGLIALALVTFGGTGARLIAPFFGLAAQPFWLSAAIESKQLGVLVVSLAYTLVWLAATWRSIVVLKRMLDAPISRSAWWSE